MLNVGPLADRVMGRFPLSIATSLAIEGAIGEHPDRPTGKNELVQYDEIWVNVKTLFRNLYNAVERDKVQSISKQDFYDNLEVEVDQLRRVIESETQGRMKVVFYICDYAGMEITYHNAILRGDTTPTQKAYTDAMIAALLPFVKNHQDDLKTYRLKITDGSQNKVLLLTHFPIDLFSKAFRNMALLESHTGAVKERHQWYTKYLDGKNLPQIPFMEGLMLVFGDKEHFRPMSIGVRKAILDLANDHKWSQATTLDKVRYSISTLKDHFLRDQLRQILR